MIGLIVGIDCGKNTGFAVVQAGKLLRCETGLIHEAMTAVANQRGSIAMVLVEDARQRSLNPGDDNAARWQGVGSVKRDAVIWEDYLTAMKIPFRMVKPKDTKMDAATFNKAYGWTGSTSNHARDAAVIALSYRGMP